MRVVINKETGEKYINCADLVMWLREYKTGLAYDSAIKAVSEIEGNVITQWANKKADVIDLKDA